jgi:heavy metal sensor kinase
MNSRSLKFRLVTWYAGWLAVLFVVFGIFVYQSLSYYLKDSLREALARRARQVADLAQRTTVDWETTGREIQSHFAPEANSRLTRVTINGEIVYVSGPPADANFDPRAVPAAGEVPAGESFVRRALPDGRMLYVVVLSRSAGGRNFVIEEGFSEGPIRTTLEAWLTVLVLGLLLLIVGAALGGFWLAQKALHPVDQIIGSAQRISSLNLSERLPVHHTGDELERLSIALNSMIGRLDDAFQQTRRFLADASHELRTPLTMMQAELEAIHERSDLKPNIRELAASGLHEVQRLKTIVEGLLALSRLDAGEALEQRTPVDLAELAATTAEQMCLLAEDKGISVMCHSGTKVMVEGDRSRLKQVMVNLLDNAIKYTPSGGNVTVNVFTKEDKAVTEVRDDGIGIPREAVPRVFDRFFRVDKARSREEGGAGLGLAIVKSICVAHGGRVEVQSEEGAGSRFTVSLPLSNGATTHRSDRHT